MSSQRVTISQLKIPPFSGIWALSMALEKEKKKEVKFLIVF